MRLDPLPFTVTDWSQLEPTMHPGTTGHAEWRTFTFGSVRVRRVDYSPGYLADHWCAKGHIVLCVHGELTTELKNGDRFTLSPGMSYQVGDDVGEHRSSTEHGASLFIVD